MNLRLPWLSMVAVALVAGAPACSSDDGEPTDTTDTVTPTDTTDTVTPTDTTDTVTPTDTTDTVTPTDTDTVTPTDTTDTVTPTDTTDTITPPDVIQEDVVQPEECELEVNVARRQAIIAAQPVIGVRTKDSLTRTTTFASLGADPTKRCSVTILFKDSNGNGALDPFEDWTLTPEERATDLLTELTDAQKIGLLGHPNLTDAPTNTNFNLNAATQTHLDNHIRFGKALMLTASATNRARWANSVQAAAESKPIAIPFVISLDPSHSAGNFRARGSVFSRWPHELGLAATRDPAIARTFGQTVSQEFRAVGVRMALGVSANLATEPRWFSAQFGFGQDATRASAMVDAYVHGLQGDTFGRGSVAAVVSHFPGAGPAKGGFDTRLSKGKYLSYRGNRFDDHVAPFAAAFTRGAAAVMTAHGVPETGAWTGLSGAIDGSTIEQVGASFNETLLQDGLRDAMGFTGFVLAPPGVLDDAGGNQLGAPWGVESLTRAQRAARAVLAGVDQFAGVGDLSPFTTARTANDLTAELLDRAAGNALALMFRLGLFEDPYVDEAAAPALVNTDNAYRAGLNAMNRSMVLIRNVDKPEGWLNGEGDGTQTGDKGNAGNGTLKVLPAPPGEPYVAAGCAFFILGNFDLDYVRSVSAGYGELTNDATSIDEVPVNTAAERIARSDYVFVRLDTPYTYDADSGTLGHATSSLTWSGQDNADALAPLTQARNAINALPSSKTQIIVGIDAGRLPVLDEILAFNPAGVYVSWSVTDKVFLDVAFGIVSGVGRLPAGFPASNAAASTQLEDVGSDGQHSTYVEGYGFSTTSF